MANIVTIEEDTVGRKGGLVSEPPLTSPALKAMGAMKGSGSLGSPSNFRRQTTPMSEWSTAPNTPCTPFTSGGSSPLLDAFSLDASAPNTPFTQFRAGDDFLFLDSFALDTFTVKEDDEEDDSLSDDGLTFLTSHGAPPTMAALEQNLDELKCLHADKIGYSFHEEVVAKDGAEFIVTRGAAPSMAALEQSLDELKVLYEDKIGYSVNEEVVAKDGVEFIVTRGVAPSMAALQDMLNEAKTAFKGKFGMDYNSAAPEEVCNKPLGAHF